MSSARKRDWLAVEGAGHCVGQGCHLIYSLASVRGHVSLRAEGFTHACCIRGFCQTSEGEEKRLKNLRGHIQQAGEVLRRIKIQNRMKGSRPEGRKAKVEWLFLVRGLLIDKHVTYPVIHS